MGTGKQAAAKLDILEGADRVLPRFVSQFQSQICAGSHLLLARTWVK
jgi:hypothetical protein